MGLVHGRVGNGSHTSSNNHLLVRLFYKDSSPHYETLSNMTEAELEEVALTDIKNSLGITGKPVTSEVTKWHREDATLSY